MLLEYARPKPSDGALENTLNSIDFPSIFNRVLAVLQQRVNKRYGKIYDKSRAWNNEPARDYSEI